MDFPIKEKSVIAPTLERLQGRLTPFTDTTEEGRYELLWAATLLQVTDGLVELPDPTSFDSAVQVLAAEADRLEALTSRTYPHHSEAVVELQKELWSTRLSEKVAKARRIMKTDLPELARRYWRPEFDARYWVAGIVHYQDPQAAIWLARRPLDRAAFACYVEANGLLIVLPGFVWEAWLQLEHSPKNALTVSGCFEVQGEAAVVDTLQRLVEDEAPDGDVFYMEADAVYRLIVTAQLLH